jgi:hypothetical protein
MGERQHRRNHRCPCLEPSDLYVLLRCTAKPTLSPCEQMCAMPRSILHMLQTIPRSLVKLAQIKSTSPIRGTARTTSTSCFTTTWSLKRLATSMLTEAAQLNARCDASNTPRGEVKQRRKSGPTYATTHGPEWGNECRR